MNTEISLALCVVVVVLAGVAVVIAGLRNRAKQFEMAHRERLAMIERGMAPPLPGAHPLGDYGPVFHDRPAPNARMMSIGVATIAFGLALGMIIGFAGDAPDVAVGLGGAVVFIGAAFVVNAMLAAGRGALPPRIPPSPPPFPSSSAHISPSADHQRPE